MHYFCHGCSLPPQPWFIKIIVNSMGPLWDGNEVWLLTAGGVTFAAFPQVYAVMFSSLYSALMLILFALILRAVAFEFRGKVDSEKWRKVWEPAFLSEAQHPLCCSVLVVQRFTRTPEAHKPSAPPEATRIQG